MKIISKEKDYYDYVAHQFGGGDPKLILNRTKFEIPKELQLDTNIIKWDINLRFTPYSDAIEYAWLVLLGKLYLVYYCNKNQDWKLAVNNEQILNIVLKKQLFFYTITMADIYENKSDSAIDLCKDLNKPYFIIKPIYGNLRKFYRTNSILYMFPKWQNLGNIGFTKLISPEQMYQNISLFVGQYLYSPEVIDIVDNDIKIENHGFNLKTSFRPNIK